MSKFSDLISNLSQDNILKDKLTPELQKKIHHLSTLEDNSEKLPFLLDILTSLDSINLYFPEIFNLFLEDQEFFNLDADKFNTVLQSILFWQDWKIGIKVIEKVTLYNQMDSNKWLILSEFTFKLGQLCYNLFKGSNYALTLLFFEKTLNYVSRSLNNKKVITILSATLWFIGKIEFEKGYSIKSSDYTLSSMYYQKEFTEEDFNEYFQENRVSIRNAFILSSFQGATEYFIASKVSAQSFQRELAKNYLNHSYQFVNRILRILKNHESDHPILDQIRTFLLQLHSIIDKEGFITNHSCDMRMLSLKEITSTDIITHVNQHRLLLDDKDKRIFWLTVLDKGGISIFEYDFEENKITSKNTLYSSFIHVISRWGEVELESGPVQELNFLGNSFIIESAESIEVVAVVSKTSPNYHFGIKKFANDFNNEFNEILNDDWTGNTKIFESKGLELIEVLKRNLE